MKRQLKSTTISYKERSGNKWVCRKKERMKERKFTRYVSALFCSVSAASLSASLRTRTASRSFSWILTCNEKILISIIFKYYTDFCKLVETSLVSARLTYISEDVWCTPLPNGQQFFLLLEYDGVTCNTWQTKTI